MLIIEGGRPCLYQWDVDQRLEVLSDEIVEVHFVNAVTSPALVCEVYEEDGRRFANVPNILLQQIWPVQAYGCCDCRVREVEVIKVVRREKPADYVYTETEVKTFSDLEARIKELEKLAQEIPKPEGKYELIEEFTVEEDGIARIDRNVWPDGTPYDLTHWLMLVEQPAIPGITGNRGFHIDVNTGQTGGVALYNQMPNNQTLKVHAAFEIKIERGRFYTNSGGSSNYPYLWNFAYNKPATAAGYREATHNILSISLKNNGGVFSAGTKITLYGVRA